MLPRYSATTNIIRSLSDQPNQVEGFTPADLKLKFDQGAIDNETYTTLLVEAIELQYATKSEVNQVIAGTVNIIDASTGKKYVYVVVNGVPGIMEVA